MALQPSSKTSAIPADIWMHVAQFVPDTDLRSIFSLNRVFFQLYMDARYRELSFGAHSDLEALWRLKRVRDPSIAHRVRSLYINLGYGNQFYDQYNMEGKLNPGWTDITVFEGTMIMMKTVACLTNVTEFSVKWWELMPREHGIPLLLVAWKIFGSRLRKFSFRVPVKYLDALLPTADDLVALTDLDVSVGGHIGDSVEDGEVLAAVLAPFINKVAPTLHSLSYSSSFPDDLNDSPFFDGLVKIPNLERLRITIPNYVKIPTEPIGPIGFICKHVTTLRHLDWDQRYDPSNEPHFMILPRRNNLEEASSNLCTLRIPVPENPGWFAMVVQLIKSTAATLTSLTLIDEMSNEDINSIISLFAPHLGGNLTELGFSVEFLAPELILLLAQTLPRLVKLKVHTKYVTGREAAKPTSEAIKEDIKKSQDLNAGIFADMIRTYDLRGWRLRDIDIDSSYWDNLLPRKLMSVLAECVPSVRTFRGKEMEFYEPRTSESSL